MTIDRNQHVRDLILQHTINLPTLAGMLGVTPVTIYNWTSSPPRALPPIYIHHAITGAIRGVSPLSESETITMYKDLGVIQQTASKWRYNSVPKSARIAAAVVKQLGVNNG